MDLHGKNFVNAMETEPLCASLSNWADILTMMRGWPLSIFKSGQKVKVTIDKYGNTLVTTIETEPLWASSLNLVDMWPWWEDESYWFWRSKVNIDLYSNNLVNTIETGLLYASSLNVAYMFTMWRGWTLLTLNVKVITNINGKTLWTQDWTVLCIFIKLGIHINYN